MKEKKTEVMTIRVTATTKQAIEAEAARREWSPSKMADKILTAWVEQQHDPDINIHFHQNTINNVNIEATEMTSILCTKNTGIVYFFSMATSFTKAALGAEGVGSDVTMIMGNGYTKGHAEITLQELRECEALRKVFTELYA